MNSIDRPRGQWSDREGCEIEDRFRCLHLPSFAVGVWQQALWSQGLLEAKSTGNSKRHLIKATIRQRHILCATNRTKLHDEKNSRNGMNRQINIHEHPRWACKTQYCMAALTRAPICDAPDTNSRVVGSRADHPSMDADFPL